MRLFVLNHKILTIISLYGRIFLAFDCQVVRPKPVMNQRRDLLNDLSPILYCELPRILLKKHRLVNAHVESLGDHLCEMPSVVKLGKQIGSFTEIKVPAENHASKNFKFSHNVMKFSFSLRNTFGQCFFNNADSQANIL